MQTLQRSHQPCRHTELPGKIRYNPHSSQPPIEKLDAPNTVCPISAYSRATKTVGHSGKWHRPEWQPGKKGHKKFIGEALGKKALCCAPSLVALEPGQEASLCRGNDLLGGATKPSPTSCAPLS